MSAPPTVAQMQRIAIFQGLSPRDLATLAAEMRAATYPAQTALITAGEPGDRVYVVLSGTVKVFTDTADGSEVILALLGPGEVVGEMSLVDNLARSASVTTLETSVLASIDRERFWRLLHGMPQMMSNMVTMLSRRLRLANLRIEANAALDVEGRIALHLLALAETRGQANPQGATRIPIRLSQNDLAALAGASRVRVNQIIVDYKRRGYIAIDRDLRISLLNPEALRRRLDAAALDPTRALGPTPGAL